MKNGRNLFRILLLLGMMLACNFPTGLRETPITAENESATPQLTTEPITTPTPSLPASQPPIGVFTLAVLVDLKSETRRREPAQVVVGGSKQNFLQMT